MVGKLYYDLARRRDLEIIADLIPAGSRVLDLGCGDGLFLRDLREAKNVRSLGIEINQAHIADCIANGVPVIQGDLDKPLEFADDGSFDVVILSRTLQQVQRPDLLLPEIVRVGRRAVVSFINFGYFQCRLQLLLNGRMPKTRHVPYSWYNTPNIHLGTILDFRRLCAGLDIAILRELPIGQTLAGAVKLWPNLLAPGCVFELERRRK